VAKQKSSLGRGLDALIAGASQVISAQQSTPSSTETLPLAPLERIIPNPLQPRRGFPDDDPKLLALSMSIKEHGLLQPIVVSCLDGHDHTEMYQIIAGERRWRAAKLAGLTTIPIIIKEVMPQQMLTLALIENIQRADLNPIEEAQAYQTLIQEFGLTQEMVARQVGKDRTTITNMLRLLQLSPKVREALISQTENFTEGHARTLVGIACEEDQVTAMNKIIALRLNVRQAEELAARIKASEHIETALQQATASSRHTAELEAQFRNALMVKVDLKWNAKGKGTLVLHFNDQEELESLYSRLVKRAEE
jgi:ParB family chromosome partitioning protein